MGNVCPAVFPARHRHGLYGLLPSRLLQDTLLGQLKLGKRKLPGTELSFATHLELATAIAEGRADAGIGTLSPSRSLGLDFVPLVWERYDLLTTYQAFYHRATQTLFEMVKSD